MDALLPLLCARLLHFMTRKEYSKIWSRLSRGVLALLAPRPTGQLDLFTSAAV